VDSQLTERDGEWVCKFSGVPQGRKLTEAERARRAARPPDPSAPPVEGKGPPDPPAPPEEGGGPHPAPPGERRSGNTGSSIDRPGSRLGDWRAPGDAPLPAPVTYSRMDGGVTWPDQHQRRQVDMLEMRAGNQPGGFSSVESRPPAGTRGPDRTYLSHQISISSLNAARRIDSARRAPLASGGRGGDPSRGRGDSGRGDSRGRGDSGGTFFRGHPGGRPGTRAGSESSRHQNPAPSLGPYRIPVGFPGHEEQETAPGEATAGPRPPTLELETPGVARARERELARALAQEAETARLLESTRKENGEARARERELARALAQEAETARLLESTRKERDEMLSICNEGARLGLLPPLDPGPGGPGQSQEDTASCQGNPGNTPAAAVAPAKEAGQDTAGESKEEGEEVEAAAPAATDTTPTLAVTPPVEAEVAPPAEEVGVATRARKRARKD
jgi:hypothetical protein